MSSKELVMYSRKTGCPFVNIAKRVLQNYEVPYRELFIDADEEARQRVIEWTGFLSVPTLVVAEQGQDLPYTHIEPLPSGTSPRGVDRGPMLTEGNTADTERWLRKHGFIPLQEDEG